MFSQFHIRTYGVYIHWKSHNFSKYFFPRWMLYMFSVSEWCFCVVFYDNSNYYFHLTLTHLIAALYMKNRKSNFSVGLSSVLLSYFWPPSTSVHFVVCLPRCLRYKESALSSYSSDRPTMTLTDIVLDTVYFSSYLFTDWNCAAEFGIYFCHQESSQYFKYRNLLQYRKRKL